MSSLLDPFKQKLVQVTFNIKLAFVLIKEKICLNFPKWSVIQYKKLDGRGNLILGRYLLEKDIKNLIKDFINIKLIIVCLGKYELNEHNLIFPPPKKSYLSSLNIDYDYIDIEDYKANVDFETVMKEIKKIDFILKNKHDVYIHCRAGRGRSWMIVMCYLIYAEKLKYSEASLILKNSRKIVRPSNIQIKYVAEFLIYLETTESK